MIRVPVELLDGVRSELAQTAPHLQLSNAEVASAGLRAFSDYLRRRLIPVDEVQEAYERQVTGEIDRNLEAALPVLLGHLVYKLTGQAVTVKARVQGGHACCTVYDAATNTVVAEPTFQMPKRAEVSSVSVNA